MTLDIYRFRSLEPGCALSALGVDVVTSLTWVRKLKLRTPARIFQMTTVRGYGMFHGVKSLPQSRVAVIAAELPGMYMRVDTRSSH